MWYFIVAIAIIVVLVFVYALQSPHQVAQPTPTDIDQVKDFYNPRKGRFTSWWQRGKAESRTKLLTVLNDEQLLVIQSGAILEESIRQGRKTELDFDQFVAQHQLVLLQLQHSELLINEALAQGLTLETAQEVKRSQLLTDIELEKRWKEIVQDLNAADLVQMGDHQLLNKEREYLAAAIRERHSFLTSGEPDEVKTALLPDIDQHIRFLQDRINARQTRLLSLEDGEETLRTQEATANSLRPAPKEIQTTQEPVPSKRPRGRPRKTISD